MPHCRRSFAAGLLALALLLGIRGAPTNTPIAGAAAVPLPNSILFVTQLPIPADFTTVASVFGNHRGDLDSMMEHFTHAAKTDPQRYVLIQNVNRARAWFKDNGPAKKIPLALTMRHDFQLLERTMQPTLPGPLAPNFDEWTPTPLPALAGDVYLKTPDREGSRSALKNRLKVISS